MVNFCMNEQFNDEKMDIFDKLMQWPLLNIFEPFYKKHKEILKYLFFGGLAFFLNIGLFALIGKLGISELINNGICWVVCVLFQFITNRTWVFESNIDSTSGLIKQVMNFFGGRVFTLIIEDIILAIFITYLGLNALFIKLCAQIIVIVLNYVISKVIVFRG